MINFERPQTSPRLGNNNFDLLRLLFATTVCLVHAHTLSGYTSLAWIAQTLSSDIAVKAFFVVSGFLIFMSYERSSSLASYAGKRVRRIYPAYFTIVMLCALSLWSVSSADLAGYFSTGWVKYVAANLLFMNFLQQNLPGVFDAHRLNAVNGALWTLKIEVMFYAAVPVLVYLFRRFGHLKVISVVYALSLLYVQVMLWQATRTGSGLYTELARQLPGQLTYFMAGAFLYYFLPLFERHVRWFVGVAALVFLTRSYLPLPYLEPFALGILVCFFGLYFYAGNVGKYGDFSYGVYIIHFPVIQLFVHFRLFRELPGAYLAAVLTITLLGAVALWHLVEKRFLLRSSHYVDATREGPHSEPRAN